MHANIRAKHTHDMESTCFNWKEARIEFEILCNNKKRIIFYFSLSFRF